MLTCHVNQIKSNHSFADANNHRTITQNGTTQLYDKLLIKLELLPAECSPNGTRSFISM